MLDNNARSQDGLSADIKKLGFLLYIYLDVSSPTISVRLSIEYSLSHLPSQQNRHMPLDATGRRGTQLISFLYLFSCNPDFLE